MRNMLSSSESSLQQEPQDDEEARSLGITVDVTMKASSAAATTIKDSSNNNVETTGGHASCAAVDDDDMNPNSSSSAPLRHLHDSSTSSSSSLSCWGLSFWHVFAIQTTFNTTSVVIIMPAAMGLLGYIGGPLLLCLYVSLSYAVCCILIDTVVNTGTASTASTTTQTGNNNSSTTIIAGNRSHRMNITTLGDVGQDLAGSPSGRIAFRSVQVLNLVLFMPVVLNLQAGAWQFVFAAGIVGSTDNSSWMTCIGYWELICFAGLVTLLLVLTKWTEAAWVSFLTVTLASIKALVLLPYGYVTYQDEVVDTSSNNDYYLGPPVAFGAPAGYNSWDSVATGISYVCYGYAPIFIMVETMASICPSWSSRSSCPNSNNTVLYKRALKWSSIYQVVLYLVAGLTAIGYWGWNVPAPITNAFPPDTGLGIVLNIFVALAAIVDYVVASLVVDKAFALWFKECWSQVLLLMMRRRQQREEGGMSTLWRPRRSSKQRDCESTVDNNININNDTTMATTTSTSKSSTAAGIKNFVENRFLPVLMPSLFALLLVCVVPQLSSLIGIVTGFTIIGMNLYIPALAWMCGSGRRRGAANNRTTTTTTTTSRHQQQQEEEQQHDQTNRSSSNSNSSDDDNDNNHNNTTTVELNDVDECGGGNKHHKRQRRRTTTACIMYIALIVGIPLSILIIAVAFYDISLTNFGVNAFCEG